MASPSASTRRVLACFSDSRARVADSVNTLAGLGGSCLQQGLGILNDGLQVTQQFFTGCLLGHERISSSIVSQESIIAGIGGQHASEMCGLSACRARSFDAY